MSSTITVGKLATAFKAPNGKIFYLLFEKTYESNVFPQTPKWGCYLLGTLAEALKRIFNFASSCEGGTLRGRCGSITPESYIAAWLKELKKPVEMVDLTVRLVVSNAFNAIIPREVAEEVCMVLGDFGRHDLAEIIGSGGEVNLSLHRDVEMLKAIIDRSNVSLGRLIRPEWTPDHSSEQRSQEFGYSPARAKGFEMPYLTARRVADREGILLQRDDGTWYCAGWAYSVVGSYVMSLWESEMKEPGSSVARIPAFRDVVKNAASVPLGTTVAVDRTVPLEDYQGQFVEELMQRYPVTLTATGFEVVIDEENAFLVCLLPQECATWILPDQPPAAVPPRQMSLF